MASPDDLSWFDPNFGASPGVAAPQGLMAAPPATGTGLFGRAMGMFGAPGTPNGDALMTAAASLLSGAGYSPVRRSTAEILGGALLAGQQARAAAQDRIQKQKYQQAQIEALQKKRDAFGTIDVDQFTPESLAAFQASGDYGVLKRRPDAGVGHYNPGEFTPESWTQFVQSGYTKPEVLKRWVTPANPVVTQVGGVPTVVQPTKPGVSVGPTDGPAQAPLSSLDAEAAAERAKAAAKAEGTATGEATGKNAMDLPRVEQNTQQALDVIKKLRAHPGLQYITGLYSKAPIVPNTQQAAADSLAKQVQGQTFLQAYQTLRGGGQITEIEGEKATAAIASLQRAQSTEDYQSALDDLSEVLTRGLMRAREQAGKTPNPSGETKSAQSSDPLGIRK